jgi:hypothetical protein
MNNILATLTSLLLLSGFSLAQQPQRYLAPVPAGSMASNPIIHVDAWTASKVQHAYGLPETKPKAKGAIVIDNAGLTFNGNASRYTIPWADTVAVGNGVERVELWGTTGRIVRMVIPNGGGLAAAGVMHHKVHELTVEFRDRRGAYHGAVFFLPGDEATRVLDIYTHAVQPTQQQADLGIKPTGPALTCQASSGMHDVLVTAPSWTEAQIPAAYRAMVYEHIIDRMQHVERVGHVFRDGETGAASLPSVHRRDFDREFQARQSSSAGHDGTGRILCRYNADGLQHHHPGCVRQVELDSTGQSYRPWGG